MTQRIWHMGPPPHVGWWNASHQHNPDAWRWWDGKSWSLYVYPDYGAKTAAHIVRHECRVNTDKIQWNTYWPKNARVPRIKS